MTYLLALQYLTACRQDNRHIPENCRISLRAKILRRVGRTIVKTLQNRAFSTYSITEHIVTACRLDNRNNGKFRYVAWITFGQSGRRGLGRMIILDTDARGHTKLPPSTPARTVRQKPQDCRHGPPAFKMPPRFQFSIALGKWLSSSYSWQGGPRRERASG
jgi:hypothetical protein